MDMSDDASSDMKVVIAVLQEKLRHSEETVFRQERDLETAHTALGRQGEQLDQKKEERNRINTELELTKQKLQSTERSLSERNKTITRRSRNVKIQVSLVSLLFLLSSFLASFGTNLLTATPPSSLGYIMICSATAIYIVATALTALFSSEGRN
jgi:serine phosphatase RsbU (regulator of sigma subunit)